MQTEVAIIGAGPAGASAAYSLSLKGIKNVLIDRKKTIGFPVQCAEFVSRNINQFINLTKIPAAINQKVGFMDIDTGRNLYRFDGKGYMLNRDIFDDYIAKLAVKAGTNLIKRTNILKINAGGNRISGVDISDNNKPVEITYGYLIIAAGPQNSFDLHDKFEPGLKNKSYVFATQVKADLLKVEGLDSAICYFRPYIPYGYGWVFPKGKFANVGIGIEKPKVNMPLSSSLNNFLNEIRNKGLIGFNIYGKTSGLIPVSGLNNLCFGNIALCGDAAGLTHPVTGAGILSAVISGSLLGDYIAKSLRSSSNLLEEYKEEIESIFRKPLSVASRKRCELYPLMTDEESIDKTVKSLWPSFEEYYG
ncbi:MAG: NAD(P)/FAD-dependent oxidoreductase [Deltaproteobacteria bacterium]|nr:NAD(P)/FAD-dependent oxidoreductase [Deltaproteobacteria bacterium]